MKVKDYNDEDEYGKVCCRCWNSVCDPLVEDCNFHPFAGKDRWCHLYNKPVFNLTDASHCPGYNDD